MALSRMHVNAQSPRYTELRAEATPVAIWRHVVDLCGQLQRVCERCADGPPCMSHESEVVSLYLGERQSECKLSMATVTELIVN